MKIRNHKWLDTVLMKPVFGLQVYHDGRWKNAAINGKPIWCETEAERDEQRTRLKRLLKEQQRDVPN